MSEYNQLELKGPNCLPAETDGWQRVKPTLIPFRPEGCDVDRLRANEALLERKRVKYARRLMGYLEERGYTIHPNATPGLEDIFGLDTPFEAKRIAFPKHIMANASNRGKRGALILRGDIPILYILAGFAHEATHLDRYFENPEVREVMQRMVEERYLNTKRFIVYVDSEGRIKPDVIAEEVATDVQAFFLLRHLGIPVEPENFCTYVGRGKSYQKLVYERIRERLEEEKASQLG